MLASCPGKNRNQYLPDYVLFDLETTGINCNSDDIIEISALRVRSGKIETSFSTLVNPGRPIPYGASQVNHITDALVADAPTMEEILPEFIQFIGEDVLVGHNIARFDLRFLYRDCQTRFSMVPDNDYVDTLSYARGRLPNLGRYSLTALAEYYRLPTEGAHRALNDCRMNQQVFERLAQEPNACSANQIKRCPKCGNEMRMRRGRFGEFYGCSGYPLCRYTENIV